MKKMLRWLSLHTIALLVLAGASHSADIVGTVTLPSGGDPAGVTLLIQSARLRTGDSPMCPTCWSDCQRFAHPDAKGEFRIAGVSDDLVFNLLALGDGLAPATASRIDPKSGPTSISINKRDLSAIAPTHQIRGRVLGPDGKPLPGASIVPMSSGPADDDQAISDARGEFVLCASQPFGKTHLKISAPGHASTSLEVSKRTESSSPVTVSLLHGSTVQGRVLHEGRPVPNIAVGAAQLDRTTEVFLGPVVAITDTDGRFALQNLVANEEWVFYGEVNSFKSLGFIPTQRFKSGADQSLIDLGDIPVKKAASLQGRLTRQDGVPFPNGTRVSIGREPAWDNCLVDIAPDGSFAAHGLPTSEELALYAPRDTNFVSSPPTFKITQVGQILTFTLTESHADLILPVVWKDQQTRDRDALASRVTEEYTPYLKEARLPQDREKDLIETLIARQTELQTLLKVEGSLYLKRSWVINETHAPKLKAILGTAAYQSFVDWENRKDGMPLVEFMATAGSTDWITPEEAQKMALAMGRVQRKIDLFHVQRASTAPLSQEELKSLILWVRGLWYESTAQVLPASKHDALGKAVEALHQAFWKSEIETPSE